MATDPPLIRTLAGGGTDAGDDLPPLATALSEPTDVALDADGNLLIADYTNHRIRLLARREGVLHGRPVAPDQLATIVGTGIGESGPDGLLATQCGVNQAGAVHAFDGHVFVSDYWGSKLRMVPGRDGTFYGQPMQAGHVYTLAGTGTFGFSGEGAPGPQAQVMRLISVKSDSQGNLYLADFFNHRIRLIPASDGVYHGRSMQAGHLYTVAGNGRQGYSPDGLPARQATMNAPHDVAFDPAGNLYVADMWNHRIAFVPLTSGTFFGRPMQAHHLYTIAGTGLPGYTGDGGPAESCRLDHPHNLSTDALGNVAVADLINHAIRILPVVSGRYFGQDIAAGTIRTVVGTGTSGYEGDGGPAIAAKLNEPYCVVWDAPARLLIADKMNHRIREVLATP